MTFFASRLFRIGGPVAVVLALIGGAYWKGQSDATRKAEAARAAEFQETTEAINDAPVFNPGDPAARVRLCELAGLSDCHLFGDSNGPDGTR